MKIPSPKTEHSSKDSRVIPLFRFLRIELTKLYRQAKHVLLALFVRVAQTMLLGAPSNGWAEPVWERLIQNLRARVEPMKYTVNLAK